MLMLMWENLLFLQYPVESNIFKCALTWGEGYYYFISLFILELFL